jgi:glycine cleavage system aminomethyltransferase T
MTDNTRTAPLKRTPLYDVHVKARVRMVPFGGWEMPVHYTGIIEEHRAVRRAVGLFDISHMGELEIAGPQALATVQRLCTNDAFSLAVGQVQYTLLCYADAGIVGSVLTLRERVADMGAKFGSATMTSWPRASKQRATHSLSVETSIRMRARAGSRARRRSARARCGCAAR